jgi:hypothetical protein
MSWLPGRDPSGGRRLTAAERALVASVFGEAVDPDPVRLHHRRWWFFQPDNVVMAPDGDIWIPPRSASWRDCYASAGLPMQALFVHEMTHVLQTQQHGRWYLPLMRHPFCRYDYRIEEGRPFDRYGIEQQAEIVADAHMIRAGIAMIGKPPLAVYEALLPFGR